MWGSDWPNNSQPTAVNLNILADRLAHLHLQQARLESPPPYRPLPAALALRGSPIVQRPQLHLSTAIPARTMEEYHLQKYHWTAHDNATVDLDTYHGVYDGLPHHLRVFVCKAHARWLPTNKRLQQIGYQTLAACPYCPEDEDYLHLFHCPNSGWKNHFLYELSDRFEEVQVDPATRDNFIAGVSAWFEHRPPPVDDKQQLLGWSHAFTGKLHRDWRSPNEAPSKWTRPIARFFVYALHERWKTRCDVVQNNLRLPEHLLNSRRQEIRLRLESLYDEAPRLLAVDRQIFHRPLQEILDLPTSKMKAYLEYLEHRVRHGRVAATRQLQIMTKDIRLFFPPYSNPPQQLPPPAPEPCPESLFSSPLDNGVDELSADEESLDPNSFQHQQPRLTRPVPIFDSPDNASLVHAPPPPEHHHPSHPSPDPDMGTTDHKKRKRA